MRARAEDRIRGLKDCGLRNLPLHEFTKNAIWLELVQLASRTADLDPDPRLRRQHRAVLGAQTAPATRPARRRPDRHHRTAPLATTTPRLALGRPRRQPATPACTHSPDSPHQPNERSPDKRRHERRRSVTRAKPIDTEPDPHNDDPTRSRMIEAS